MSGDRNMSGVVPLTDSFLLAGMASFQNAFPVVNCEIEEPGNTSVPGPKNIADRGGTI